MAAPGFFYAQLSGSEDLWLEAATAKHIVQVLRMEPGDAVLLTDGAGLTVEARILEAGRKGCLVRPGHQTVHPEPVRYTTMAVSLLKNTTRFEWLLEKSTELGIRRIVPLLCRRTEKQHFRRDRMQSILVSALIQSQQSWLPKLEEPVPFADFVATPPPGITGIGYCGELEKLPLNLFTGLKTDRCTLAIGPEGDFTEEEMKLAIAAGFIPISLGKRRLRTETAALAAVVMLQLTGDT